MYKQHTGHPGEYRPFGADTGWCVVCDRPFDRSRTTVTRCDEHGGHAREEAIFAREERRLRDYDDGIIADDDH